MSAKRSLFVLFGLVGVPAALFYFASVRLSGGSAPANPAGYALHAAAPAVTEGTLAVLDGDDGSAQRLCPLEHTDVKARISGHLARVNVTQRFTNPYDRPIEAVYVFPLPADAAVDEMTIRVGERTIKSQIKRREEARKIYDTARNAGQLAALLDQERPNIFTQAVANIRPGDEIEVNIHYIETLAYDAGAYELVFPMVVGPRYMPGSSTGKQAGGFAPDTTQVPDASRISPTPVPPGTRAGHDISIEVDLDAGVHIRGLDAKGHEVLVDRPGETRAVVRLKEKTVLPNKDFVLRYDVAGEEIGDVVMAHQDQRGGFFSLVLEPPKRFTVEEVTPKELVFVLDVSGSMSGFPMDKAKETMKLALDGLYPRDTFNLITFAGETKTLFPRPVPATRENLAHAQRFLASRQGGGGTEMMQAIRTALAPSDSQEHVRIVCFMTDGYIGNDMAILGEIQQHPNARIFSCGVGSSTNRFLLDKRAEVGRGEVEYVALTDDGSAAARRFHERVRNPLLTDVSLDFGSLDVEEVYPKRLPDLFSAKPVVVTGRFKTPARGSIRLSGKVSGEAWERAIPVNFASGLDRHEATATLWARAKINDLMQQDYAGVQSGQPRTEIKEAITQLGLDYRLMTQFTSFVAVEETIVTEGGKPMRVEVPVEMPEGVSFEGVFGDRRQAPASFAGGVARLAKNAVGFAQSAAQVRAPSPLKEADAVEMKREEREAAVQAASKLDPKLVALLGQTGQQVEVEVWLVDPTPEALAKVGFVDSGTAKVAKIRTGRIAVERLDLWRPSTGCWQ